MKIAIVGTGWYGCYIAEYILDNFKNVEITMYDKNKDFFTGSSYYNQNRLHLGYHYSRSFKTRHLCKETFKLFKEKYYQLIDEVNKNYYIVSKESILEAVLNRVPKGTEELNKLALESGYALVK